MCRSSVRTHRVRTTAKDRRVYEYQNANRGTSPSQSTFHSAKSLEHQSIYIVFQKAPGIQPQLPMVES